MPDTPPPQFGRGPRNFAVPPKSPPPPREPTSRRRWLYAAAVAGLVIVTAAITLVVLAVRSGGGTAVASPSPAAAGTPFVPTDSPTPAPSPSDTPSPTPGTTPAAATPTPGGVVPIQDPRIAVAQTLYPAGPNGTSCGSHDGNYAACPVTAAFATKLHAVWSSSPPYEPLCRCLQGSWTSVSLTLGATTDTTAQVSAHFVFSRGSSTVTLSLVLQGGTWLGSDTMCGGNSLTSFDASAAPPPCTT